MDYYEKIKISAGKKLQWVTFLMAYPFWAIVQNISFFVMISFYISASRYSVKLFRIGSLMSIGAVFLALASIISTISAQMKFGNEYLMNSLTVLPNYIYWATMIIGIGNIAFKVTTINKIFKTIFWGTLLSIISYNFLSPILNIIPFYRNLSPNGFAFVLIIFSPIATSYLHTKKKNLLYTLTFILIVTLAGFLSGSRSGSLLTLFGCFTVLAINNWMNMFLVLFTTIFLYIAAPQILESPSVRNSIKSLNPRTYALLYQTEETLETDRSYLTRLAMIEKGMTIFKEHPITGVGLNNFTKLTFDIQFDFEGGQYLESKEDLLGSSISAHNSYISFLSEGGILLFLPMLFLMFYPLIYFVAKFNQINGMPQALFIAVFVMCIHSWFISSMLNVYAWFLLAIVNSYIIYKRPTREL